MIPHHSTHKNKSLRFYSGLIVANAGSACLTCLFGLLHLQVFLQAYHLPLKVYSVGSTLFAVINTANDVAGAWLVDSLVAVCGLEKHQLVGISGCLFAACFLTPFFRFSNSGNNWWAGAHFVTTLSLYDTLWSFHCILLASIITDHSTMSDKDRQTFLAVGKLVQMLVPLLVAKIGLAVFQVDNLWPLRQYLILIAVLVSLLSLTAQHLLTPLQSFSCTRPKHKVDEESLQEDIQPTGPKKKLQFRQVVQDFVKHPNFCYWIGMEMLMEGQNTFLRSFMKTFVDQLLLPGGLSKATCDWFLSSQHALIAIADLLLYIPIRHYGYAQVYSSVFRVNALLAFGLLLAVGTLTIDDSYLEYTTIPIFAFLLVYPVLSSAMASAGFGLAMADMVLEMKVQKAHQGRGWQEPSIAGLFMGVNALFCKPMESILPIVTATLLGNTNFSSSTTQDIPPTDGTTGSVPTVLFRLLVLPPLIGSILQYGIWAHYDLKPAKTKALRKEWEALVVARGTMEEEQSQPFLKEKPSYY